jgi:hypothetical protein
VTLFKQNPFAGYKRSAQKPQVKGYIDEIQITGKGISEEVSERRGEI